MGYETLTEFERALARFGDKVELIVGLEVGGKMNADEAYKEIKDMMKTSTILNYDFTRIS
jgi:ABC-type sugar transport system substrate-binding protein